MTLVRRLRSLAYTPVVAALIFQGITLLVGVASVPVLLIFLSASDFLAWILIATFGAFTIQVEQGILIVAARRLARPWHSGDRAEFLEELAAARRSYSRLSMVVLFGLGGFGFLYFGVLTSQDMSANWPLAWVIFVAGYALNYWFGYNSAILLSSECTAQFNLINASTRSLNFATTVLFLWMGLSILGLAASFLLSVGLSVFLIRRQAQGQLARLGQPAPGDPPSAPRAADFRSRSGRSYIFYTLSNFALYKGAFLLFPLFPGVLNISDYGLALQLVAIVYGISIIPTQVWLSRLVVAVLAKDAHRIWQNLWISLGFVAVVFALFLGATIILGRIALDMLGSDVSLPENGVLGLMFLALMIEAVIFVIVNLLLILGEIRFLRQYVVSVAVVLAACCAIQMTQGGTGVVLVFLLVPMAVQALVSLPFAIRAMRQGVTRLVASVDDGEAPEHKQIGAKPADAD